MKSRSLSMTSGWVTEPGTWSRDEESLSTATNLDLSSPGILAKRRGLSNNTLNSFSGCIYSLHSSPVLERDIGAGALLLAVGNPTGGSTGFRVGTRASTFAAAGSFASDPTARPKLTTGPDGKDIVTTWLTGGVGGPLVPTYTGTPSMAYLGIPSGMGLDRLNTATSGVAGFLPAGYACRYAVTFSLGDPTVNGTQQGAPGMTTVFINTTINAVDVATRVLLPVQFRTSSDALPADTYWVQVFRSASQASSLGEPPSELALVYQQIISAADIALGYVSFTDIVPDIARGANLYTNLLTGEDGIAGRGFLNSNEGPPQAKDVATWADCVWFASTEDLPTQEAQLIAVGGAGLVAGDTFDVGGTPYIAVAGVPVGNQFQISGGGTASVNQRETALNLVDAINRDTVTKQVWAFYVAGVVGQPGRIVIRGRTQTSTLSAATSNAAAFRVGTESANNPALNGLAFSKPLQPHAFPAVNFFQLGRGDAEILRIMPYRDSLFVFKEDGLWRVTGTDFRSFSAQEFDLTFRLQSREALVALDDALYCWGAEGIARITDGGVEYIDAPIRNQVVAVQTAVNISTMRDYAFAVGRPRDGVVHFFYPVSNPGDSATDPDNIVPCVWAFTWHARTQTWSLWDMQGDGLKIGYSCGTNNVVDKLMSLGIWQAATVSGAWVHNERRSYVAADFSDPDMSSATAPTMAAAAISMTPEWRAMSSDALGSAQWIRLRIDCAEADATRQTTVGPLATQMFGDDGLASSSAPSPGTASTALPRTFSVPVGQECSRSHALSISINDSNLNQGCWLVSTTMDYRPFSTKATR